jgi:hypothetical protein
MPIVAYANTQCLMLTMLPTAFNSLNFSGPALTSLTSSGMKLRGAHFKCCSMLPNVDNDKCPMPNAKCLAIIHKLLTYDLAIDPALYRYLGILAIAPFFVRIVKVPFDSGYTGIFADHHLAHLGTTERPKLNYR